MVYCIGQLSVEFTLIIVGCKVVYSVCNLALSKYTFGIFSQMAARQTQRKPALHSNESESVDDLESNQHDDVTHSLDPQPESAGKDQPIQLDEALESRLDELIQ